MHHAYVSNTVNAVMYYLSNYILLKYKSALFFFASSVLCLAQI